MQYRSKILFFERPALEVVYDRNQVFLPIFFQLFFISFFFHFFPILFSIFLMFYFYKSFEKLKIEHKCSKIIQKSFIYIHVEYLNLIPNQGGQILVVPKPLTQLYNRFLLEIQTAEILLPWIFRPSYGPTIEGVKNCPCCWQTNLGKRKTCICHCCPLMGIKNPKGLSINELKAVYYTVIVHNFNLQEKTTLFGKANDLCMQIVLHIMTYIYKKKWLG